MLPECALFSGAAGPPLPSLPVASVGWEVFVSLGHLLPWWEGPGPRSPYVTGRLGGCLHWPWVAGDPSSHWCPDGEPEASLLMDKAAAGACIVKQGVGLPPGLCRLPLYGSSDHRERNFLGDVFVCACWGFLTTDPSVALSISIWLIKRKPRI